MDSDDLVGLPELERVLGGGVDRDFDIEYKGPFIELPEAGPAKVVIFERPAGSLVWDMIVGSVERAEALVMIEMSDGMCPCCGEDHDE
jgi:hypothetical protein